MLSSSVTPIGVTILQYVLTSKTGDGVLVVKFSKKFFASIEMLSVYMRDVGCFINNLCVSFCTGNCIFYHFRFVIFIEFQFYWPRFHYRSFRNRWLILNRRYLVFRFRNIIVAFVRNFFFFVLLTCRTELCSHRLYPRSQEPVWKACCGTWVTLH